jgi:DNA-directed RNA polymerase specialized sigma24 family protein
MEATMKPKAGIVLLYWQMGWNTAEIADKLEVAEAEVYRALRAALERRRKVRAKVHPSLSA